MTGLIALLVWAIFSFVPLLGEARADATLFGLPLRTALAVPIGLPVFVLVMFWFAQRQNRDDERFGDDD
jgi:putative solute:sodium symporter small subunit